MAGSGPPKNRFVAKNRFLMYLDRPCVEIGVSASRKNSSD